MMKRGEISLKEYILIVEDEIEIQSILKELLLDAGYQVDTASDGLEGITAFRQKTYDLILLDCPPVGLVTDGVVAASYCDGTILVCASNRNDRKELLRVKDQLEQTQVNVIGIVMTMMPVQKKYYNSYGYRYSDSQKKIPSKKKKTNLLGSLNKKSGKKK